MKFTINTGLPGKERTDRSDIARVHSINDDALLALYVDGNTLSIVIQHDQDIASVELPIAVARELFGKLGKRLEDV